MGLWDLLKQTWTIARHSLTQAIRMKIVLVLVAFLIVLVPLVPIVIKSDNTHAGQVKLIITYCFYLTSFFLSVLTLFLSASTLNTEIRHQHIFLLDPKPVPRCIVLLGKWLGVMLINTVLLAAMMATTYGLVRWYSRPQPGESPMGYAQFKAEMLTARESRRPPQPKVEEWVEKEFQLRKDKGMLPKNRSEDWLRAKIREQLAKAAWRVPPNGTVKWVIEDVPEFDGVLVVHFMHHSDSGKQHYLISGEFVVNESGQPISRLMQPFQINKHHTFGVPKGVRRDDGTVEIRYTNYDKQGVAALFPFQTGIEVLYPAGSLAENFFRGGLMILLKLTLIAILGIFASTFLSFPVAILFVIAVFMVGHMINFVFVDILEDLYVFGSQYDKPGSQIHPYDNALRTAIYYFFNLFPNFGRYDVTRNLQEGYIIGNMVLFKCFMAFPFIRGGILAVAGWYIFRRRELAVISPNM